MSQTYSNLRCKMPMDGEYEKVKRQCRTDLVPKTKSMELILYCDTRCEISYPNFSAGGPTNKSLICEEGSDTWEERSDGETYKPVVGFWPVCGKIRTFKKY